MPVITGTGPVGRIDKVYGDYADVTLISDPGSSIDVVIPRTGGRGMLDRPRRGRLVRVHDRLARAPDASPSAKVQVGDEIVTSGLGASFPPGLVVGKVIEASRGDDGMFQRSRSSPRSTSRACAPSRCCSRRRRRRIPTPRQERKSEPAFGGRPL